VDTEAQRQENKVAEQVSWLGFASNIVLAAGKTVIGLVIRTLNFSDFV
jgi:hypothetical protein